jgi:hypothetical protein
MTESEIKAMLEKMNAMQKEIESLKTSKSSGGKFIPNCAFSPSLPLKDGKEPPKETFRVLFGGQTRPASFYANQWVKILKSGKLIASCILANRDKLKLDKCTDDDIQFLNDYLKN